MLDKNLLDIIVFTYCDLDTVKNLSKILVNYHEIYEDLKDISDMSKYNLVHLYYLARDNRKYKYFILREINRRLNYDWSSKFNELREKLSRLVKSSYDQAIISNVYSHGNDAAKIIQINKMIGLGNKVNIVLSEVPEEYHKDLLNLIRDDKFHSSNLNLTIDEYLKYKDEYNLEVYDVIRSDKVHLADLDKHKIDYVYEEALYNPHITVEYLKQHIEDYKMYGIASDGSKMDIMCCEYMDFLTDHSLNSVDFLEFSSTRTSKDVKEFKGLNSFTYSVSRSQIIRDDYLKENIYIFSKRDILENCFIDPNVLFDHPYEAKEYNYILSNSLNRDPEYIRVANMILRRLMKL